MKKKSRILLLTLLLLAAVLVVGTSYAGARRWLNLGFINFQPSELSKVCFVLFGTVIARKNRKLMNTGNILKDFWGYLRSMFWFAPILVPVALQNLSSAIILAGIVTMMFFCISMQKKYFWIVVALLAVGAYAMVNIKEYRSERIDRNDGNTLKIPRRWIRETRYFRECMRSHRAV